MFSYLKVRSPNLQPGFRGLETRYTCVTASTIRSTIVMAALQFAGKILGFLKTVVVAAFFGASGALDAFWVAYTIPTIAPAIIKGVVATAFIPRLVALKEIGGGNENWSGLNTLFTLSLSFVLLLSALLFLGAGSVVALLAPGMSGESRILAVDFTRIMAIAIVFFGINAILGAYLQARRRFALISLESVLANLIIIAACVWLAVDHGVRALVWSVVVGFGLFSILLVGSNWRLIRGKIRPALDFRHADFEKPVQHMIPLLIGYLGASAMLIIDRMFVSTLESGAISILAYASMIALLPMEVFGQAVMTTFYPQLSEDHSRGNASQLRSTHLRGLNLLLFILIPTTAALVFASEPLVKLLLERGSFSSEASALTASAMCALALGLPFRAVNYFNFRVFHARQEPWVPVKIGLLGVVINTGLDFALIDLMGVTGIALATSISLIICASISSFLLHEKLRANLLGPLLGSIGKLVVMTAAMVLTAAGAEAMLLRYVGDLSGAAKSLAQVLVLAPGLVAFMAVGLVLNHEESRRSLLFIKRAAGRYTRGPADHGRES